METKEAGKPESGDGLLLERLRDLLVERNVDDELRVQVLNMVDKEMSSLGSAQAKVAWRLKFQRSALQVALSLCLLIIGLGWYRLTQMRGYSLAIAYKVLVQRFALVSQFGVTAMDLCLKQITIWMNDVVNDKDATPNEREIRIENLKRIGDALKGHRATYQSGADEANRIQIPERIDALTVVKDPFTRQVLPLNLTPGASLDPKAVQRFMDDQPWIMGMMLAAKEGSAPGTKARIPKYDSRNDEFVLDVDAMAAAGVKMKSIKVEEPGVTAEPKGK